MLGFKNRNNKKAKAKAKLKRRLVTISNTRSFIAEQFRTIRTNIKYSAPDIDLKTILVTSSTIGEGKSTNVGNLGVVFAQEGKKVLIVDADMRKPTMHYIFGVLNTVGLSTVLARQNDINSVIQETPILGLHVLPSGRIPPNPAELLSSKRMEGIFDELKELYDIVIFDSPPLLSVADAQILSNKCDGTLLVIDTGAVEREDVIKATEILKSSHSKIMGTILNNYNITKRQKKNYLYYRTELE
jgi:protein-tyrosine kinase